jgi:chorismate mutase
VLLHVNTDQRQEEMTHVYLHGARKLRPDLDSKSENKFYTSEK